jgi:hypothetical protein
MPPFWRFLCQQWLGLTQDQTACWWRALGKSRWSQHQALRHLILAFDRPYVAQRVDVEKEALSELVAGACLIELCEQLVRQGHLLRRDATVIEERVLARLGSDGEWK